MSDAAAAARRGRSIDLMLLVVMFGWGLNIPVVKGLTEVISPLWAGTVRMMIAAATLTVCVLVRDRRLPVLSARQWLAVCGAGALMIYVNQLLFTQGLRLSTATSASLVMALNPGLSACVSALAFRERPSKLQLLGLAVGLAGVAVVVLHQGNAGPVQAGIGEAILLTGMFSFVLGGGIVQRLGHRVDPLRLGWAIFLAGTLMLVLHTAVVEGRLWPAQAMDGHAWMLALYSGMIGTAVTNVGWYHAINTVGIARSALFFYWLPIFGVLCSAVLFRERLTWWHLAGLLLVIVGTRLGTRGRPSRLGADS